MINVKYEVNGKKAKKLQKKTGHTRGKRWEFYVPPL